MGTREIRFVGRISRWREEGLYAIVIPAEVTKKYKNVLEEWNRSKQLLIIEVKVLDGMVRQ